MISREEATSTWRAILPPKCLQQQLIAAGVEFYINNNKIRFRREFQGDRTGAFAEEKAMAKKLLSGIDDTLSNARIVLEILPYSTMMLEDPRHAVEELLRWSDIRAEAIEVSSHLKSRIEAASKTMYWYSDT